jgi:hypothetical protein
MAKGEAAMQASMAVGGKGGSDCVDS